MPNIQDYQYKEYIRPITEDCLRLEHRLIAVMYNLYKNKKLDWSNVKVTKDCFTVSGEAKKIFTYLYDNPSEDKLDIQTIAQYVYNCSVTELERNSSLDKISNILITNDLELTDATQNTLREVSEELELLNVDKNYQIAIKDGVSARLASKRRSEECDRVYNLYSLENEYTTTNALEGFMDLLSRDGEYTLKSAFPTINERVGGYSRGDSIMIGAGSGKGKSLLLLQEMYNQVLRGKKVLYFTIEMSPEEMIGRLIPRLSGVEYSKIRKQLSGQKGMSDDEFIKVGKSINDINSQYSESFTIYKESDWDKVSQLCINTKYKSGLDMVIFDYIQLFDIDSRSNTQRHEKIREISLQMKKLASKLDIVCLTANQIGSTKDGKPDLYSFQGSTQAINDFSLVMVLDREELENGEISNNINCRVVKSRHSGNGADFWLNLNPKTLEILEGQVEENIKTLKEVKAENKKSKKAIQEYDNFNFLD
jgi:KaiC/GvpD/RAD55 family RecA-like ATPase